MLIGGIFLQIGDDAKRPFANVKFCLSVLVFFLYTHIMTPVLLCELSLSLYYPVFARYVCDSLISGIFYGTAITVRHVINIVLAKYITVQSLKLISVIKLFENI